MRANEFISENVLKNNIIKNNESLKNLKQKFELIPFFNSDKDGKPIYVYDNMGRYTVIINYGGMQLPFYWSTGSGGKAGVESQKWYPFFGIGSDGWLNKGTEEEINNYYGSSVLKNIAQTLNATFKPFRDRMNIAGWSAGPNNTSEYYDKFVQIVNKGFLSPQPNKGLDDKGFYKNQNTYLEKLQGIKPEKTSDDSSTNRSPQSQAPQSLPAGSSNGPVSKDSFSFTYKDKTIGPLRLGSKFGQTVLSKIHPDEARFVSSEQFEIIKNPDNTFSIKHDPSAKNATMINGVSITSPVVLRKGMRISVGNPDKKIEKAPFIVS